MADVTGTFYPGAAAIGYGSQWLIGQDDGSPETFVAVADIESIQFGDLDGKITVLEVACRRCDRRAQLRSGGPSSSGTETPIGDGSFVT